MTETGRPKVRVIGLAKYIKAVLVGIPQERAETVSDEELWAAEVRLRAQAEAARDKRAAEEHE